MLNVAICDDDIRITGELEMLIQKIAKRNFVDAETECSGMAEVWWRQLRKAPALISFIWT